MATVGPLERTDTVLTTKDKAAFVPAPVGPGLNSIAVLLILVPVTHVPVALEVLIGPSTMGHLVLPLTSVSVSRVMYQASVADNTVCLPIALKLAAVLPDLSSSALAFTDVVPLAIVNSLVCELYRPWTNRRASVE